MQEMASALDAYLKGQAANGGTGQRRGLLAACLGLAALVLAGLLFWPRAQEAPPSSRVKV